MKTSYKQQWIEAIKQTIEEYKNGTHRSRCIDCKFCQLTVQIDGSKAAEDDMKSCKLCIMHNADHPTIKKEPYRMSCLIMQTYPSNIRKSLAITYIEAIQARISFWSTAMSLIENLPAHYFWPSNKNKKLVRSLFAIDDEIYKAAKAILK